MKKVLLILSSIFIGAVSYAGNIVFQAAGGGGGVTSVSGTAPIASSGGTTPAISLNSVIGQTETFTSSATFNSQTSHKGTVDISSGVTLTGSAGTNGQLLTSGGPGAVPTWTTVSGGASPFLVGRATVTTTSGTGDSVIDSYTTTIPDGGCLKIQLDTWQTNEGSNAETKFWIGTSSFSLNSGTGTVYKTHADISLCNATGSHTTQYVYGFCSYSSIAQNCINGAANVSYDGAVLSYDFSSPQVISVTEGGFNGLTYRMNWTIEKTY